MFLGKILGTFWCFRLRIRIQAGQNCPKKKKKFGNFKFEDFSVGLEASPVAWMFFLGVQEDTYYICFCLFQKNTHKRLGMDPDPNWTRI